MWNYIFYRIGQAVALLVPRKIGYAIAVVVSDIRYLFADEDKREVYENLKVIFPEKSDREIKRIRRAMFRNFAKYLVDFFRFPLIDSDFVKQNITIENIEYIDEALRKGNGAIALTAHIGNWELGGAVIALSGYSFWAVALAHKHKKVNDFFTSQRESKGVHVIPFGKAVRQCLEQLKKNNVVALVGDRDFSDHGRIVEFFGKPTCLPQGAAVFSVRTGAPIVPGFMVRNHDDSFTLKMEKAIDVVFSDDNEADAGRIMDQYKRVIETYIRAYPDQWYMFKRFWRE